MRLSRYTSEVADHPSLGQHLLYNWLTQAVVVVDEECWSALSVLSRPGTVPVPIQVLNQLAANGIVVADGVDERAEIESWHREVRSDRSTYKAIVLTTYACNFGCTYCVEEGIPQTATLSPPLADQVVRWIIARTQEQGSTTLWLNLYGGEPLLNLEGVVRVATPLAAYARDRGLEFSGSITTNGSLLTREVALCLIEAGINRANVTLDGDQKVHDARRPYRDGCGTFETIVHNLAQVSDLLDVYLTGNVDDRNVATIPLLLDHLGANGLLAQVRGLHFGRTSAPAREGLSRGHIASLASLQAPPVRPICPCSAAPDLVQDLLAINAHLAERGLASQPVTGASLCLLNQGDNAVVIDPLGRLYKCPALVGHEAFCVGNISQTELDYRRLQLDPTDLADCLDCRWFPPCGGGCRFVSFLETGDIRRRHCNRSFYETHAAQLVRMDYGNLARDQVP